MGDDIGQAELDQDARMDGPDRADRAELASDELDPAEAAVFSTLDQAGEPYERMACDPALADTAAFCAAYGIDPVDSANTILVIGKSDPPRYVACVVLATTRLDVNGAVRKRLGARKASFASAEETRELTGMLIGGVTAFGLPADLPVWVDAAVTTREAVVLGGGSRSCKVKVTPAVLVRVTGAELVEGLAR
jgi:prolyl-tRNA editing enzyme YbaK/EbsC (Cys-tRNA(Pro) deacylase)